MEREPMPATRIGVLKKFVAGGPKLRFVFFQIQQLCILLDQKLLITEATTMVATEIEMACNYMHIEARVMHSGLTAAERSNIAKEFRNDPKPSKLMVLIILYDVSTALGVDLHDACFNVVVFSPGRNTAIEFQGFGRVIRVSIPTMTHEPFRRHAANSQLSNRPHKSMRSPFGDYRLRIHTMSYEMRARWTDI
jgi:Helicase conserved C-terminal domain